MEAIYSSNSMDPKSLNVVLFPLPAQSFERLQIWGDVTVRIIVFMQVEILLKQGGGAVLDDKYGKIEICS